MKISTAKNLKKVMAGTICATALFAVLGTTNINAFAAQQNVLYDNNFSFVEGAYISMSETGDLDLNRMMYRLEMKNPELEKFFDEDGDKGTFSFTVYRMNEGSATATAVRKDIYFVEREEDKIKTSYYVDEIAYMPDDCIKISSEPMEGNQVVPVNKRVDLYGGTKFVEYSIRNKGVEEGFKFDKDAETGKAILSIILSVESPNSYYYVDFEYSYEDFKETKKSWDWSKFWFVDNKVCEVVEAGKVSSSSRSIIKMLETMDSVGYLSEVVSEKSYQEAIHLIENTQVEEIQIQYLSQISDTPFAEKKQAKVTVPVYHTENGNLIEADDIESALGGIELDCLGSHVESISKVEELDNVYEVVYHKAVCLKAKTADGKTLEYFLDLNNSYEDYYGGMIQDDIFSAGLYSYFLNEMKSDYPALNEWAKSNGKFDTDNLYGYFGYAVVPEMYTWDNFMREVFDVKTDFQGVLYHFEYNENLTLEAYNKLLGKEGYDYGWLEKAWGNVVGGFTGNTWATHFVFYADPNARQAVISDTGNADSNNNNGAGENVVDDKVNAVEDVLDGFLEWIKEKSNIILNFTGATVLVGVAVLITVGIIKGKPKETKKSVKVKRK